MIGIGVFPDVPAERITRLLALPKVFSIGNRVWVLLHGERKWKATVVAIDHVLSKPSDYVSYDVRCDADERFPEGCALVCREHELELLVEGAMN